MPHVSGGTGGDDLDQEGTDEIKVYDDEGGEDEKRSENLTEEKSSLIDLTESEEKGGNGQAYSSSKNATRSDLSPVYGKLEPTPHTSAYSMGFLVPPYSYHNGATAGSIPVSMASKIGLAGSHPFFCPGGDPLGQPPPAHMGIPPYQLDPKGAGEFWRVPRTWKGIGPLLAASGITRPAMYPFSSAQYPYPMLSPDMSQVASWHTPSMYPIGSAGSGFRSPYPSSLPITNTTLSSDLYRFSPTGLIPPHPHAPHHPHPHPGLGSPHALSSHQLASGAAVITPGPKQELGVHPGSGHPGSGHTGAHGDHNHRSSMDHSKNSTTGSSESKNQDSANASNNQDKKKPHIKKPLNAFMLYMKEMRSKVVAECTLKESAAINQILGRRWHALSREEQAKYYELARRERQLHMQLYPDWSSRANTTRGKKRKRKQDANDGGNNMKKCRARYGLDQQSQWCKPCRRKKKCIRYMEAVGGAGGMDDGNQSDDNLGSCGSVGDGDAHTPLDDDDHDDGDDTESMSQSHSLSSPGGLSGFSSLTSPSMILPSPSTSLASPSVSLASPGMSLQSPLTPLEYDCKPPQMPLSLPLSLPIFNQHSPLIGPPLNRQKVGTNPHDINNPLSVNQLTGKCIKTEPGVVGSGNAGSASGSSNPNNSDSSSRAIRVT